MTNTDLFSRYIWLIELIYRCDGISRAQINREWAQSVLNVLGETEIPERTFHRYKTAIKQLFGIEIYSSRTSVSSYHIREVERITADPQMYWLLHSCVIGNFLRQYKHLSHRILLECGSGGREHLAAITEAMRTDHTIVIDYSGTCIEVEPFFIKLNLHRWYLIGRDTATGDIATYSLAQIRTVSATDHPFTMPADLPPPQ
ncbi:MAG: helix-turn-helix transcriptional regulator [Muribaculaceae bacterium]